MIDIATIIEWSLIVLVFGMYFTMPIIIKMIDDFDRKLRVFKALKISYFIVTVALIGFIVYEFFVYEMETNFRVSRAAMIVIAMIMYYYTVFVKSKQWFK